MQYLTDGRMKYIWFPYLGREQLFDLSTDPGETHDLAVTPDHTDELAAWRQRLIDLLTERGSRELIHDGKLRRLGLEENWSSPHYQPYGYPN